MPRTPASPTKLPDLLGKVRRRWHVLAVAAIIGAVLGGLLWIAIPTHYTSTSTVAVNPINADPLRAPRADAETVNMATEREIVRSQLVADKAATIIAAGDDARWVIDSTEVTTPSDSLILSIEFTADSASLATKGADAVAEAYLTQRRAAATEQVRRLTQTTEDRIAVVQAAANRSSNRSDVAQRALIAEIDSLGDALAALTNLDLDPGQVVGAAETPPDPSTASLLQLGLAGLLLGLLAGIPVALSRKDVESTGIGSVEAIDAVGGQVVLDGTNDADPRDTWDIAAFMLKLPHEEHSDDPYLVMVDSVPGSGRPVTAGQELVDALERRGRTARYVDAGTINEGKISRGWPTDKKRASWAGEVVIIDSSSVSSDANKVALATRSDAVLLARSTEDDAAALHRFTSLLESEHVNLAMTTLFPPRPEMISLAR